MADPDYIRKSVMALVEQAGAAIEPDGDWKPVLFIFDSESRLSLVALDAGFVSSPEGRERLLSELPELIRGHQATRLAFVATVVSHSIEADGLPAGGPEEKLQIQIITPETGHEIWYAPIIRQAESFPQLGEWVRREGEIEPGSFVERFGQTAASSLRPA